MPLRQFKGTDPVTSFAKVQNYLNLYQEKQVVKAQQLAVDKKK